MMASQGFQRHSNAVRCCRVPLATRLI